MTKEELEKATGQELIDERDYCGVDGYRNDLLKNVNAEMLKRFNRLTELESKFSKIKKYLAYKIPHELMNEATNKIWHMI